MKESLAMVGRSTTSSGGRSESEKERTKMRERQRRAITTKIFHGLRKHGGYHLSPRADINEVLRELAKEAGWIIEPDGTTFRSKGVNCCHVCGAGTKASTNLTPTSSIINIGGGGGGGGGGECSTTASPLRIPVEDPMMNVMSGGPINTITNSTSFLSGDGSGGFISDLPMVLYMYGGLSGGIQNITTTPLQEARASNQNTPVGSPLRRA